jgi:Rad52/22 family double-strand break repair protein
MGFSAKQLQALRRPLDGRQIRTREAHGRELSYIEGWFAISEANRIFGFDAWSRETLETRCVLARETRGTFLAVYIAKVRITVQVAGATVIREGHGSGEGRGTSPGDVHDIALKAAETDASKRAFATFGRPFGLELYRQSRTGTSPSPPLQPTPPAIEPTRFGFHPDDTTPIPRPSRYYGRRQSPPLHEHFREARPATHQTKPPAPPAPPLAPAIAEPSPAQESSKLEPAKIDKSILALAEPRRRRDKSHLRFVAAQPCLVCGRHPSDPHHLRFAQPRALGIKVSDEFTVPLCRGHHRQLHQAGNEIAWWKTMNIDALPVARQLWEQTHPNEDQTQSQPQPEPAAKP